MASSAILLTLTRLLSRSLDLITLVILTRFLLPDDFGLVAIALSIMQVTEAVLELPTAQALLQSRAIGRRHLDTAFTIALLRGLAIGLILCGISVPLALFYGDPRLVALTCAMALAPAIRGLRSPKLFLLLKGLRFGPEAINEFVGKLVALAAASAIAVTTQSYWAIAAGTIVNPIAGAICSFILVPYRPRLSLQHWRLFRHFIGWSMASQALRALNWQVDRFALGKLGTQAALGIFSTTRELAGITYKVMFDTMHRPILAALATANLDPARQRRAYSLLIASLLSVGLPIACGQALVAGELVRLVLGEKWLGAIPVFQAISLTLIPGLYSSLTMNLLYAVGKPDLVFRHNLQDAFFRIPVTVALIMAFGLKGAIFAVLAADIFLAGIYMRTASRITGLPVVEQLALPWRGLASTLVMVCVVMAIRWAFPTGPNAIGAVAFLVKAVPAGALAYGATHLAIWRLAGRPEGIEEVALRLIRNKLLRGLRPSING